MGCICSNQSGTVGAVTLKGRTRPIIKVVQKSNALFMTENVNGLIPDLRANPRQSVGFLGPDALGPKLFEIFNWVHQNLPSPAHSGDGLRNRGPQTSGSL